MEKDELTALLHHIPIDVLRTSFFGLKKTAAPGVDEMTWIEYAEHLGQRDAVPDDDFASPTRTSLTRSRMMRWRSDTSRAPADDRSRVRKVFSVSARRR
jgi:hypothetical protein